MTKRVLAFLMVIAMVLSLVPTIAVAADASGYTLTLQKAHNQTDNRLAVDVYLTAATADQGDVTGYQFEVTPADGLNIISVTDFTGNDGVAGNSKTFVYSPTLAASIAVGTTRVPVATIVLEGETIPPDFASALTLSNISVSTTAGFYQDTVVESENYLGAVTVATAACEHDHEAGLTWTPITAEELFNADGLAEGNYYLTGDVAGTTTIFPAAENAEINLCLNGYELSSTAQLSKVSKAGSKLHISDCTATGTGEDLVAGKIVLKYYRWGNVAVAAKNATAIVENVILEGAEDAVSSDTEDGDIGNAAAFYVSKSAVGGGLTAENVLIKNVESGKTVVDNRTSMHLKDVTFVNCSGGVQEDRDLGIIALNGAPVEGGELIIEDCKFINCDDEILHTNKRSAMTFILKGNVQATTSAVFVNSNCNLTLDLDEKASVLVETEEEKTAETFGEAVNITDTLPKDVLTYKNLNALVNYADGVFSFGESHTHADGYAGEKSSVVWEPWTNPNALPSVAGYYYLTTDVTMTAKAPAANINICLNGHTIDSSKAERFCQVYGYERIFCDCQGYADPEKAGTIIGGTTDEGSVFHMRGRTSSGNAGKLHLYDIKLTGNGTNTSSSAIFCGASTVGSEKRTGTLEMERVEVYGHDSEQGGVLQLQVTEGKDNAITITIDGCNFHDNTASSTGAAMYLRVADDADSASTSITIKDTTFHSNESATTAGAIYVRNLKNLTIEDCEFTENKAKSGVGGAINSGSAATVVDISGSTFTGNTATSGGGAIYTVTDGNTLKLDDCTITGNTDNYGGGVYITSKNSVVILSGKTIIASNTGAKINGGLYYQAGNVWTTPLMQVNELAKGSHIDACYPSTKAAVNTAGESGDEVDVTLVVTLAEGATQTTWDCGYITYYKSTTEKGIGISYIDDPATEAVGDKIFTTGHYHTLADGTVQEYTAWAEDRMPTADDNVSHIYLSEDISISTAAAESLAVDLHICFNGYDIGGTRRGFYVTGTSGVDVVLDDCTGYYDADNNYYAGGITGGTQTFGCGVRIDKSTSATVPNTLTINGGKIYNNTCNATGTGSAGGGVMYIQKGAVGTNAENVVTMNGGEISGNVTSDSNDKSTKTTAGNIYLTGACTKFVMNGGTIKNNSVSDDAKGYGGAFYCGSNSQLVINGGVIEGNSASQYGGAFYCLKNSQLVINEGAVIEGNTADYGGAFYCNEGTALPQTPTVTINGGTIKGNSAETGAAIYAAKYANVSITDGLFEENAATNYGGVFYGGSNSQLTITGGTFKGNSAKHGGVICAYTSTHSLSNCTLENNTATNHGGAIFAEGTTLTVTDCTVTGNTATYGAAMTLRKSAQATLKDTTITGNHVKADGYGTVAVGSAADTTAVLTVSGKTIIDDNTYVDSNVEENVTLQDNCTARIDIGDGGLSKDARIGVKARAGRLDMGVYYITSDVGGEDPSQYFTSDDSNYSIAKVTGKLPTYYAGTTAKPTTHEAGAAAEAEVAAAQAMVESGDYYQIITAESAEIAAEGEIAARTYTYLTGYVADAASETNHLAFVSAKIGDVYYNTVQEAIAASAANTVVQLQGNVTEDLTVTQNVTIDLNGNDVAKLIVDDGYKVSIIDDKAKDYNSSDAGKILIEGDYEVFVEDGSSGSTRRYAIIENDDGTVTAHRIYVAINAAVLRTVSRGVGYKMIFAGDQAVQAKIAAGDFIYGAEFTVEGYETQTRTFDGKEFTPGISQANSTHNQRLVAVENIVNAELSADENNNRAGLDITARPFIRIEDGDASYGAEVTFSMSELITELKKTLTEGDDKTLVEDFIDAYSLTIQ